MAARVQVRIAVDAQREAEFDRALELLRELVDWSAADREFPRRENAVYTTSVVLWMLVSQRMNPEGSLETAVKRLTDVRFQALRRQATVVSSDSNSTTYSLTWRPSAKERKTHPELPIDAAIEVRLHEIRIHDSLTLCLVTSLPNSAEELSDLYRLRGDIEIDIRNLKVVLNTERILARSVDMFHKELLMSQVAYNLVTPFRRQAAALIAQPPRRMSFKKTWTTFNIFLGSSSASLTDAPRWRANYRQALTIAAHDKLPNRPGRSCDRETYPRPPKSNHFKKRRPKNPAPEPDS